MGKGSMSAISGQPTMGQPNTNSNTGMQVANPTLPDQYSNTVGQPTPAVMNNQPVANQTLNSVGGGKGKGA
jgi:hypothetical protein